MLSVRVYGDAAEFYERVKGYLLAREAEHNLILGLVGGIAAGLTPQYVDPFMAAVEADGAVVSVAMRTPPHNLVLSEGHTAESIAALVPVLRTRYGEMAGVSGPPAAAAELARQWQAVSGQAYSRFMAQRIYRLSHVTAPDGVAGHMRPAEAADRDLLVEWLHGFHVDAGMPGAMPSREETAEAADRYLSRRGRALEIWVDGAPVSTAGYGGYTEHGVRIGPVYTPPEYRRRGYASACVAALSQRLLDEGRTFCFLYTDLANPTSNHVYQAIGYEPVSDVDMLSFEMSPGDQPVLE